MYQKGSAALILILLILAGGLLAFLIYKGFLKNPLSKISQEASVNLTTEYKNPFDKANQYVNPFDQYKNPFDQLK